MSDISSMTAEQAAEWGKTLDFPAVWATVQGFGKKFDEIMAEVAENRKKSDAELAEIRKKNDAELAELQKKTDAKFAELAEAQRKTEATVDKVCANVGGLNRSMGELIELLIAGRLWEKFAAYPYELKMAYRRIPLHDHDRVLVGEVDILLVDTVYAMAVEVKREADIEDVNRHIKRLGLLRQYPPLHMKAEKLLGAIAGGFADQEVKDYAHSKGFFVIELEGDNAKLAEPPKDFRPQEW